MDNNKVFSMKFSKVFPLLIQKAERKNRNAEEVFEAACWLTGYSKTEIESFLDSDIIYGDFFLNAPEMNPKKDFVTGSICGIKIEKIEDPLMKDIRILDKLVDEIAKGKPLEKILIK